MIPKIVHMTWKDKSVLNSKLPMVERGLSNLIKLNPEWTVTVYDDDDVNEFLKQELDSSDFKMIENDHMSSKSDLWRLIMMYKHGGLYTDTDRYCNVKIDDIIDDGVMCVLPICRDLGFSQDFMLSSPENPIFKETAEAFLERRKVINNVYYLGPQTYNHIVTKSLTGEVYEMNIGEEKLNYLRSIIEETPFLSTYKEESPYNTILYRGEDEGSTHEFDKRRLYYDYGLTHWTGEW